MPGRERPGMRRETTLPRSRSGGGLFLQGFDLVGRFPREGVFAASEVAKRGSLAVDRPAQLQGLDNPLGRQLEGFRAPER